MRKCPDGQRELDESEFYKIKSTGKLYSYCKKCASRRTTEFYHREKLAIPNNRGRKRIFDYELIRDLLLEGFSDINIAAELGCSRFTVSRVRLWSGMVIKGNVSLLRDKRYRVDECNDCCFSEVQS
jgi:hypothetical protein